AELRPLPLDDVQVGAAHARRFHLDEYVQWSADHWFGHLVDRRRLLVLVDSDRSHGSPWEHGDISVICITRPAVWGEAARNCSPAPTDSAAPRGGREGRRPGAAR